MGQRDKTDDNHATARITGAGMYQGRPTDEALELADAILDHLVAAGTLATEAAVLAAMGGDEAATFAIDMQRAIEKITPATRSPTRRPWPGERSCWLRSRPRKWRSSVRESKLLSR